MVLAGSLNPIPSRTRPLNSPAPMVLSLKTWKSRSLPGLPKTEIPLHVVTFHNLSPVRSLALSRSRCAKTCGAQHAYLQEHKAQRDMMSRTGNRRGLFYGRCRQGGTRDAIVLSSRSFVMRTSGNRGINLSETNRPVICTRVRFVLREQT